ncbi:MAG: hypothetical protein HDKAJFGB_03957 [Anaerolineae bacterium]|nr:hypothetical protein [Anaerolineae bacterium]
MQNALDSRAARWLGIVAVGFLAACLATLALNLYTPPRDLAQLLPTRTPTRRPPPTITPVAYPPTPALVLSDTLRVAKNFPEARGVKLPYGYQDNAYLVTPPLDPGFARALNQTFVERDYLNLSVNARAAPTPASANIEYGILFWHGEDEQGRERFLAFTVNTQSEFRLLAFEPVTATVDGANVYQVAEVISATVSSAIAIDGTTNLLRVDAHPRRLLAYVNDELVIDTDAKIINEWRLRRDWDGRVGVIALTMDEPGAAARFTQFDIYADNQEP